MEPKLTLGKPCAPCTTPDTCTVLDNCGQGNTAQYKVENFKGQIDGGGYKKSMDDPKKVPLALIDPEFELGMGRVLQFGAKKYAPGNWMRGMSFNEVISGIRRHTNAILRGEDVDGDSGELHAYCLACGAMFLARFLSDPRYAQFDDRLFKPAAP